MKEKKSTQHLREQCLGAETFSSEVLAWIQKENLWNLWVPKCYGGLEKSFAEGLRKLKSLAKIDGSLGWTITLCSGANYFIGNLQEDTAESIFLNPKGPVCLGGSGGVFGLAEKQGNQYKLSGKWRYATGAPYLSHFTLNAKLTENGKTLKTEDGSPQVRSFIVSKTEVNIIEDWNTMGLIPTATHSFTVNNSLADKNHSFLYNHFYLPQPIYKIPFGLFADLTLWVNYLGMAEHYLEEIRSILPKEKCKGLKESVSITNQKIDRFSEEIEEYTSNEDSNLTTDYMAKIHKAAVHAVRTISQAIIEIHPLLGIKASRQDHQLNQIFRDYFTATQHPIFADR